LRETIVDNVILIIFLILSAFNLYCWKTYFVSWSYDLLFIIFVIGIIITLHFYFVNLVTEFYKKYEILLMVLFIVFFLFIISEALLFISFFWSCFHSLSSPTFCIFPGESLYVPDPCELTFSNTLLLSNAAVSLGAGFISLELSVSGHLFFSLVSFILASLFISLQIKEFRLLALHLNDSIFGSSFYFLTGLHFFHLVVGLILLSLVFWNCSFSYKNDLLLHKRISELHLMYNLIIFYWHFLEILWLFIFLVLYFS